jgi:hypothetical protein
VLEIEKLKEIVQLPASLWHVAQRLPGGAERENALREIRGFQSRTTALIRRRWQARCEVRTEICGDGILCWRIRLIFACHNLPWFQR